MTRHLRVWNGVVRSFVPSDRPACAGDLGPTTLGYDDTDDSGARSYQATVCLRCPVLHSCLKHAVNHEPYGLWGLTELQRWHLGGVAPKDFANLVPNPTMALDELANAGMTMDAVWTLLEASGLDTDENLDAVTSWEPHEDQEQDEDAQEVAVMHQGQQDLLDLLVA